MSETTPPPSVRPRRPGVPVREVAVFVGLAYTLAWLVFAPALLGGAGPADPAFGTSTRIYVFTPAAAALLVVFAVWRPARRARALGLAPLRPVRRAAGYSLLALPLFAALGFAATLAAAALGVIQLDLAGFSGLRAAIAERTPSAADSMSPTGFPTEAYLRALLVVLVAILPLSLLWNLGEELGWRGYLLPRLLPLGVWPALLLSGLIHALWHGPQMFVHLRSGGWGPQDLVLFTASVTAAGVLFGWMRLASGSVWPAVAAHAANNTLNILGFLTLSAAGSPASPLYPGGLGGVVGLAVVLAAIGVLAATGRLRVRTPGRDEDGTGDSDGGREAEHRVDDGQRVL
ncbi:CPBP family intramembrane glutamic endopeptidase [Streptomonospora salina]|uniref:Membrane protease YdiL (CAAX protease family) n=1 Tax=Streptomonospora salina TaxID=104205 RepID=A0A841E917_9ACTN|nr:CPBP family intramembrane glutamic endopeptidase [Streptomonospora salina]MBB5997809.1 membrane protease YdiL (CAAX protease family) [Streptomonospora salina]